MNAVNAVTEAEIAALALASVRTTAQLTALLPAAALAPVWFQNVGLAGLRARAVDDGPAMLDRGLNRAECLAVDITSGFAASVVGLAAADETTLAELLAAGDGALLAGNPYLRDCGGVWIEYWRWWMGARNHVSPGSVPPEFWGSFGLRDWVGFWSSSADCRLAAFHPSFDPPVAVASETADRCVATIVDRDRPGRLVAEFDAAELAVLVASTGRAVAADPTFRGGYEWLCDTVFSGPSAVPVLQAFVDQGGGEPVVVGPVRVVDEVIGGWVERLAPQLGDGGTSSGMVGCDRLALTVREGALSGSVHRFVSVPVFERVETAIAGSFGVSSAATVGVTCLSVLPEELVAGRAVRVLDWLYEGVIPPDAAVRFWQLNGAALADGGTAFLERVADIVVGSPEMLIRYVVMRRFVHGDLPGPVPPAVRMLMAVDSLSTVISLVVDWGSRVSPEMEADPAARRVVEAFADVLVLSLGEDAATFLAARPAALDRLYPEMLAPRVREAFEAGTVPVWLLDYLAFALMRTVMDRDSLACRHVLRFAVDHVMGRVVSAGVDCVGLVPLLLAGGVRSLDELVAAAEHLQPSA